MPSVDELLKRWRAADLLDEATAERIRAYERGHAGAEPDERPGVLEALVYLGLAIVAVGVAVLVAANWSDLAEWAQVAVVLVPGVLALVAGQALRTAGSAGMRRGGHVAWVLGTALVAGGAMVWANNGGWDDVDVGTTGAIVALAVALPLWLVAPSHPQMLALGAALFALAGALGSQPDDRTMLVHGVLAVLFGAAVIGLREAGWMKPPESAALVGAGLVAWGAFFAGFESGGAETLAFVAAAALVVVSIWHGVMVYMLTGVALGFAALVRAIATHVDDPTFASLALIIVGALLIAAVLLITRTKPWRLNRSAA